MIPVFNPVSIDAALKDEVAFPAAAAYAESDAFNLGHDSSSSPPKNVALYVAWEALAAHTDTAKTITFDIYDSADGSSFAIANPQVTYSLPGIASTGVDAEEIILPLPPSVRQYVKIRCTNPSGGPAITSKNFTAAVAVN